MIRQLTRSWRNEFFVNEVRDAVANWVGQRWPACLRLLPDLTDDYIYDNEHKLRVPFYRQTDWYSCGATAGWAVVKTFHPKASFPNFYRDCNPLPLIGTTNGKLIRALRRHGIGVSVRKDLSFADICKAIESGFPLIVGIGHNCPDGDHWIVVYGIGKKPNRVFGCNEIYAGRSRAELSWKEFRALWNPRSMGLICWGKTLQ